MVRTVPELLQLGSALSDAPLSEEAVEVARELEAAQPADEQEWRQACELLDRIGSGTACQVVTERFLRSDPTNPTVNLAAVEYWSRSHLNYSKAELHLRRSVDHTAGGADFWARAAVLWQRMERWPECAKACREWLDGFSMAPPAGFLVLWHFPCCCFVIMRPGGTAKRHGIDAYTAIRNVLHGTPIPIPG